MSYQSTHIQVIDMRFFDHVSMTEFEQWLSQVEQLLQMKKYFVLIMQTAPATTFPEEYRQLQALWYKRNKQLFFQYCLGLIRIAQDSEDQLRLNSPALHAAWRVPYYVTLDHSDAVQWAVQRWI